MQMSLQQEVFQSNSRLLDIAFYHQVNHYLVLNSIALFFFVLYIYTFVSLSKYDLFNRLALNVDCS
jgi:hypothetical protein